MTVEQADALVRSSNASGGDRSIFGLKMLSPDVAHVLANQQGTLSLDGLTTISVEAARAPATHRGLLPLDGLTDIPPQVAEAVASPAGTVQPAGSRTLSEASAQALAGTRGTIQLPQPVMSTGRKYTSDAYRGIVRMMNIECSMSRTGSCYDNAVAERFFWSLKHEWANHAILPDLEAAGRCVFECSATFYDPVRLHQTLNYKSPAQFDADHAPAAAV